MKRRIFIFSLAGLSCFETAHAFLLMEDELLPKPQFSERALSRGPASLSARLLTSVGQDVVETLVNEQTEKRLFAAIGVVTRAALPLTEKIRVDGSVTAIRATASTQVAENSGWKKTEAQSELMGQGSVRYLLNEGLRAGLGATWVLRPAAQETFEFANQTAVKKFQTYSFWTPDYSLSKETSGWSAGVGWRPRVTQKRTFTREGSGDSQEVNEEVMMDERWSAGIFTQLSNNRSLRVDFGLHGANTTQNQNENDTNSSTSSATSLDNSRRRYEVSAVYGLSDVGAHRFSLGAAYQSIAYSDQSHVTPQSIPLWSLLIRDDVKQADLNWFVDALLGYGSDLQSLPDLNAKFKRLIVSLQSGVQF